jgi:hypothetical protein
MAPGPGQPCGRSAGTPAAAGACCCPGPPGPQRAGARDGSSTTCGESGGRGRPGKGGIAHPRPGGEPAGPCTAPARRQIGTSAEPGVADRPGSARLGPGRVSGHMQKPHARSRAASLQRRRRGTTSAWRCHAANNARPQPPPGRPACGTVPPGHRVAGPGRDAESGVPGDRRHQPGSPQPHRTRRSARQPAAPKRPTATRIRRSGVCLPVSPSRSVWRAGATARGGGLLRVDGPSAW